MSVDMKDYLAYQEGYEAGKRDAAPRWVRVEDGLPEGSCKVIVRCVCNSTGETDVTTAYYRNRYKKFHMTGNRSHWRVTQWMWPWDEPPKEDNK